MSSSQPNLTKLIAFDLLTVGRLPLLLMMTIFMSAMAIVFTTHHTRQSVTEKNTALQQRDHLDNEWRNLILEETALSEHSRVQDLASKELMMKRPDADKEVVIELK
ncbi:cell division protein FtsL [Vibrio sp. V27_P1S3P104]|uniref:cell division protein FtsL n=1 Tax=unclassified Vibrio TaxID=2614977 RepID=UPI00137230EE|nr:MULTISPECIES: cell division protein FtsL [unclassified Vibrio]NAW69573.1 cell division protein FtsL [Vibrio sp. V28_P6S34P95]NAX05316.1 cell division protein FtsL [Vibrio sp. V30_P3S12P165]NAX33689.1 cell division protein FtsL [Vibrio sp. V29_P1S30P107]NAX37131.1 cell division protein FtsL [Vibrio sp. V27_P1S3P104]NAX41151.1 cell division protein FtsL [Vibrio sp. V26_P1S5P106]